MRSDALRWEAAELISNELAGGKTQIVLAREISKSQQHVSIMRRVHDHYLGSETRPAFNDAYQEAKRSKQRDDEPASSPAPLHLVRDDEQHE